MKKMLIALTMLAMVSVASADVIINFNYRNFTSAITNTYGGSVWNEIDNDDEPDASVTTRSDLRSSTGAALSGVVMTNSVTGGADMTTTDATITNPSWTSAPSNVSWAAASSVIYDTGWKGLSGSIGETYNMSLSGLDTNLTWTVRIFSAADGGGFDDANFIVEGTTINLDSDGNNEAGPATAVDMQWTNITLTDGILNLSIAGINGERLPGINAIQVEGVVPEPATVGMLGLGALVSLLIRRIRA